MAFLRKWALTSDSMKGSVGKQAATAETENMAKEATQPQWPSIGPSNSWPRILPNPAIPSQMPEIVAIAFS